MAWKVFQAGPFFPQQPHLPLSTTQDISIPQDLPEGLSMPCLESLRTIDIDHTIFRDTFLLQIHGIVENGALS